MTFIAFAKPYDLVTILYLGQNGEGSEVVRDIIEQLPADGDYKDLLKTTLSVWSTDIWNKAVFDGLPLHSNSWHQP